VKDGINRLLVRATGYQLQKARPANATARTRAPSRSGERLLDAPGFVLSTVRSGSTLLRVLLDSHSQIHSPHETHLRDIAVDLKSRYSERAVREARLSREELQNVVWDWYLYRELASTGKPILVNKTPSDVFIVDQIKACWPDARFIFLLRHPVAVARSRGALRPQDSEQRNHEMVLQYANAVEAARSTYDGHTVRYEDLAADPEAETKKLCAYLGVPWEAGMLDYGQTERRFKAGLGDWNDKIRSGKVQPPDPLPAADEVPDELKPIAAAWGYLPQAAPAA
jgi:Sulfotransferase family